MFLRSFFSFRCLAFRSNYYGQGYAISSRVFQFCETLIGQKWLLFKISVGAVSQKIWLMSAKKLRPSPRANPFNFHFRTTKKAGKAETQKRLREMKSLFVEQKDKQTRMGSKKEMIINQPIFVNGPCRFFMQIPRTIPCKICFVLLN